MGNNDLDQLFRDGIDRDFEFSGQSQQWQSISAQLHPKSRKRLFWWWPIGGVMILVGGLWTLNNSIQLEAFPVSDLTAEINSIVKEPVDHQAIESPGIKPAASVEKPTNWVSDKKLRSTSSTATPVEPLAGQENHFAINSIVDKSVSDQEQLSSFEPKHTTYTYNSPSREVQKLEIGSVAALCELSIVAPLDKNEADLLSTDEVALPQVQYSGNPNRQKFTIMVGWQNSYLKDIAVQEETTKDLYIGIAAKLYRRWEGTLRYSQGSYQRATEQTPATYNIPLMDVPVGFTTPNNTELRYERQVLEVGLRHRLPFFQSPRVHLQSGLLLARNRQLSATYAYQNIYQNFTVESRLEDQPWHGAAIFGGATVEVPLISGISATAGYQFYRELNQQYLQWRSSQQWQFGLSYQF
ncbi:MAG: hypothetical protein AAFP77_20055 [Bacteroidota bacterium]